MLKFFRVPFALSGTKTTVPDALDPSGYVSYMDGYGADYARPKTDPLSKNIERDKMNQVLFDLTNALGELQAQGVPDFITSALNGGSPFSYAKNAIVRYSDGNVYISLAAANVALPTDATKWAPLLDFSFPSYAALRAYTGPVTGARVAAQGLSGYFLVDATDTATADNGGTVLVDASGRRWKRQYDGFPRVAWWGVKYDGGTNSTDAFALALASGHSVFLLDPGTALTDTISLLGKNVIFEGAGMHAGGTVIKARVAGGTLVDAAETSDAVVSPFILKNLTLDGDTKAVTCLDVRYRHHCVLDSVQIKGATSVCYNAKDSWLNAHHNCRFSSAPTLAYLRGSNHRNAFYGCSFTDNTSYMARIESNGTVADGNEAILFANCDFEFAGAGGGGVYMDGSSATLDTCYVGENLNGVAIDMRGGTLGMRGGALFYGHTAASFGVSPRGGKLRIEKARINGQTFGTLNVLIDPFAAALGGSSVVSFRDCEGNATLGGDQFVYGDPLDYGPPAVAFANRTGRGFTAVGNNVTVSSTVASNGLKAIATAAPGPSPLISVYTPTVLPTQWRESEPLYLVVVYASTKDARAYLSNAPMGGTFSIGTMPASGGVKSTYIKLDVNMPSTAFGTLEFILQSVGVGDYLTIYECFFADSRMVNKGGAQFGNLYKC